MKIITMSNKHHFFIIAELLVIITVVLLIGCKDNPFVSNRQYRKHITGKIIIHQTGGIAGVSRIITIGEKEGSILLTSVDKRTNKRLENSVSLKDLDSLWQTLETNDIFILPTNQEMLTKVRDGFGYEISVQRGEKQHHIFVYAPEQLIKNGETRYNDIVQAITLFVDSRLQEGIGGIEGTVTDLDGKPVSGISVTVKSGETSILNFVIPIQIAE